MTTESRQDIVELYIDDNSDLTLLTKRLSLLLRKIRKENERVVIQVMVEEVVYMKLKKK